MLAVVFQYAPPSAQESFEVESMGRSVREEIERKGLEGAAKEGRTGG